LAEQRVLTEEEQQQVYETAPPIIKRQLPRPGQPKRKIYEIQPDPTKKKGPVIKTKLTEEEIEQVYETAPPIIRRQLPPEPFTEPLPRIRHPGIVLRHVGRGLSPAQMAAILDIRIAKAREIMEARDPTAEYTIEGQPGRTFRGEYIQTMYDKQYIKSLIEQRGEIQKLPRTGRFIETKTGTYIYKPETVIEWRERERERRIEEKDWGALAGTILADVFSPERYEHAYRSFFESPMPGKPGWKEYEKGIDELYAYGHKEYAEAWEAGDWGKITKRVIGSPIPSGLLTHYGFKGIGVFARTPIGGATIFPTKFGTITPTTAITTGIVGYGAYETGIHLKSVYEEAGVEGVRREISKLGFILPFYLAAARTGYQAGIAYTPKYPTIGQRMGITFQKGYRQYTPKGIQQTFGLAKQKVLRYDPWYFPRQVGHVQKYLLPDYGIKIRSALRQFPKEMKFQKLHTAYVKGVSYYGSELYPIALKHKLPFAKVDPGLYKYFELREPYPGYAVAPGYLWPERDIQIMPRGIETKTFIKTTKGDPTKGFFLSVGKHKEFISYGTIDIKTIQRTMKQIGRGKRGGRIYDPLADVSKDQMAYVRGKTIYKTYAEHPLIPSIREKPFVGIVKTSELKSITRYGDIIGMEALGSFKTIDLPVKGKPFVGFGGRLFGEEYFVRGTSFAKTLSETISKPGRYGFETIQVPEMTYAISKGKVMGKTFAYYSDKMVTLFSKLKGKEYFGETGGLDTRLLQIQPPKLDIVLPGGIGPKLKVPSYPRLISPMYPKKPSLMYLESLQTGLMISRYWTAQALKPVVLQKTETKLSFEPLIKLDQIKVSIPKQAQQFLSVQQVGQKQLQQQQQAQQTMQNQLQMQLQMQQQMQKQAQMQLQMQQQIPVLQLLPVSQPYTTTFTPFKPVIPSVKPPPPPPIPILLELPDGARKPVVKKPEKGYYAMIKTRQYVHGKPQGTEKFRPLNVRRPLVYYEAKSLMGSALDHSIAQKGFLKPSDKPGKRLHKRLPSRWEQISYKFGFKKGKYTEGRPYAIDTSGEKRELDVYRWYQGLPVKKIKKPRERIISDFPGVDMYGFDKMNSDFDRMLGRLRF